MGQTIKDSELQFSKPIITKLTFELVPEYDPEKKTIIGRHINRNIDRQDDNSAIVEITWEMGLSEQSVNPQQKLSISMGAMFYWNDNMDQQTVEKLLKYNATSVLIGYIRPIVANITMNSVQQIDIPFIDLTSEE